MREGSVSREGPLGAPSGRLGLAEPAGPGVSPNASSATAELFPVRNHGVELVTPEGGSRDRLLSVAQFIDAICFHYSTGGIVACILWKFQQKGPCRKCHE